MILDDFRKMIDDFRTRPAPGKHVYVWNDEKSRFLEFVDKELIMELDVALETGVYENEVAQQDIRRKIEKALETRLSELYSQVQNRGDQQILAVTSPSVLAKYRIGLTVFYSYYLGDRTMVVFIVPKPKDLDHLTFPEYIEYDPDGTLKYLANLVGFENVVEGK
jgi:hypothetical protein